MTAEELYKTIGKSLKNSQESQLFGKPCFKVKGKAFVCFLNGEMIFKLSRENHKDAISLDGAKLFDPSGKGRPMKEWVQLSFVYKDKWESLAEAALNYVESTIK